MTFFSGLSRVTDEGSGLLAQRKTMSCRVVVTWQKACQGIDYGFESFLE